MAAVTGKVYDGAIRGSEAPIETAEPNMCNHSIRRDFRYIPSVNCRQCRWCGASESDRIAQETPSENPSSFTTT